MTNVHVCLVSDRLEANLIPLLQLKPDVAVLVASHRMQKKAELLQTLLERFGGGIRVMVRGDLPDLDIDALEEYALQLEAELEASWPDAQCVYNATGGTKLMAIIFSQVFDRTIYTHTEHDRIVSLGNPARRIAPIPIEPVLAAEVYLLANGKRLRSASSDHEGWRQRAVSRRALTRWLAANMNQNTGGLLGRLNHFVHDRAAGVIKSSSRQGGYEFDPHNARQRLDGSVGRKWQEMLAKMAEAGLLDWSADEPEWLTFRSVEACEYLSGGWLEEYAWLTADDAGCREVLCGAKITDEYNPKSDIRNEIDCLLVHNNRMLVIECKTRRLGRDEQSDSDLLTKLDSLTTHSSGLFGQGVLVSARSFGEGKVHQTNLDRAASLDIAVLEAEQIGRLPELVRQWMSTGRTGIKGE